MKRLLCYTALLLTAFILAGCASEPPNVEHGPNGTIAYLVPIEASEPGVKIEADNNYVGEAPLTLKIFGDRDGTFHNFGSSEYVIRAIPASTNQFTQTKVFRTGGWFSQEDRIPTRLYFDMNQKTSGFSIDLPPQ